MLPGHVGGADEALHNLLRHLGLAHFALFLDQINLERKKFILQSIILQKRECDSCNLCAIPYP